MRSIFLISFKITYFGFLILSCMSFYLFYLLFILTLSFLLFVFFFSFYFLFVLHEIPRVPYGKGKGACMGKKGKDHRSRKTRIIDW